MIRKFISKNPLPSNLTVLSCKQKTTKKETKVAKKVQEPVKQEVTKKPVQQVQKSQEKPRYSTAEYEKFANLEYKKYPNHLTHFDKTSKDYVASERDDYTAKLVTEEHNKWIDDLKRDL